MGGQPRMATCRSMTRRTGRVPLRGGPADEATISPYLPRIVDSEMSEALRASPAVLVEGPRACGKTWTGRQFAASEVMVDASTRSQLAANLDPSVLRVDADRTGEPRPARGDHRGRLRLRAPRGRDRGSNYRPRPLTHASERGVRAGRHGGWVPAYAAPPGRPSRRGEPSLRRTGSCQSREGAQVTIQTWQSGSAADFG